MGYVDWYICMAKVLEKLKEITMTFTKYILNPLIEIYEKEFIGTLDETGASMKRVASVLESKSDFLFITESRAELSRKKNSQNNDCIVKFFRDEFKLQLGAYKLIGHWRECSELLKDNETIKDCKGKTIDVFEEAWLIVKPDDKDSDLFAEAALKTSIKYDQEAYIVRTNNKTTLNNGKNGEILEEFKNIGIDSLSSGFEKILDNQGYSELARYRTHGRIEPIIFENFYVAKPKNVNMSKMLFGYGKILF